MVEKKLWIQLKRLDLQDVVCVERSVKCLEIREDQDPDNIRQTLKFHFNIHNDDLILRLRNHKGSLIPMNSKLVANTREVPYILETVRIYQNSHPHELSPYKAPYDETIKKQINEINSRIKKLEETAPGLNNQRLLKIKAEMAELDQKLEFINKRITEADSTHWQGMFKKNPLW